jgi:menaquinone-dependent protoporphyrinogen oxidase
MEKSVLVTYVSLSGSTEEIAQSIASRIQSQGISTQLERLRDVRSLAEYSAVVLGAPFYMFQWHQDARRFLSRFRKPLSDLPVAIFAGGPFGSGESLDWEGVRAQLDKELARFPWLRPVSTLVVGGRFDPARLRFPYSWIPAMKAMPPSDVRDWDAIQNWADELAKAFAEGVVQG